MSTGSMESSIDKEYALQPVPLTARLPLYAMGWAHIRSFGTLLSLLVG